VIAYIDTSILLEEIFRPGKYTATLEKVATAYCSELLNIEAMRTIDRYRIEAKLRDDELARAKHCLLQYKEGMNIVEMSDQIKKRAAMPFSTVVGSLDAIHLCTALYLRNELQINLSMLTLDQQLAIASMAEGMSLVLEIK